MKDVSQQEKHLCSRKQALKPPIDRDFILSKITEFDIFTYYIPGSWKLNRPFLSPFRNEKIPSFLVGYYNGVLLFVDFADSSLKGNCFSFVQKKFGLTYPQALKFIAKDFLLTNESDEFKTIVAKNKQPTKEQVEKSRSVVEVMIRGWKKEELEYWITYGITPKDLKENNIYSIYKVYLNGFRFRLSPDQLHFGYLYEDEWKTYSPFEERELKWMPNNVKITALDGKDKITTKVDTLYITKSKKDYICFSKTGLPCIGVQNEGMGCFSEENVKWIKKMSDRQVLVFDSDAPGVKNSLLITDKFDMLYWNTPKKYIPEGIKDVADLCKAHGLERLIYHLKMKKFL